MKDLLVEYWPQTLIVAIGAVVVGWDVVIGLFKGGLSRVVSRKPVISTDTDSDARPELSKALCLIQDHVMALECAAAKAEGVSAVATLSPLVVRKKDFQPVEKKPAEAAA